ncbi:MAG: hypothetical protein R2792_18560 [Saprospiraceae bacterium]
MSSIFLCLLAFLFVHTAKAQVQWLPKETHADRYKFYFYWGYNRASFAPTNLHFTGPKYDFSLYDVQAHDRPTPFKPKVYFGPTTLWIPQYNIRMGYFFKPRWSVSFGVDHMKYVMDANQTLRLSGIITPEASDKYAGTYLNELKEISPDFLQFEHSDGLNLSTFEVAYHLPLLNWPTGAIEWYNGLGALWVVTRTDVRVFGDGLNNDFHVAGYSLSAKSGLRFTFFKRFFFLFENKMGYMSLPSVLIKNDAPEIADHNIVFGEKTAALGVRFNFKKP